MGSARLEREPGRRRGQKQMALADRQLGRGFGGQRYVTWAYEGWMGDRDFLIPQMLKYSWVTL